MPVVQRSDQSVRPSTASIALFCRALATPDALNHQSGMPSTACTYCCTHPPPFLVFFYSFSFQSRPRKSTSRSSPAGDSPSKESADAAAAAAAAGDGEDDGGAESSGAMVRAMRRNFESASTQRRRANSAINSLESKASGECRVLWFSFGSVPGSA